MSSGHYHLISQNLDKSQVSNALIFLWEIPGSTSFTAFFALSSIPSIIIITCATTVNVVITSTHLESWLNFLKVVRTSLRRLDHICTLHGTGDKYKRLQTSLLALKLIKQFHHQVQDAKLVRTNKIVNNTSWILIWPTSP